MTDNQNENRNSRSADIMISLSVGLLAGVAGALLLAPASGRNTRRRIGEFAGEVSDKAGKLAHRASDTLKDQAGRVENAIVEGKQAYVEGKPAAPASPSTPR